MTRWRVLIALGALDDAQPELGAHALDGFVESLIVADPDGEMPAASCGPREWSARLTVEAGTAAEALPIAAERCYRAGREVGLPRWSIVRIGVVRAAELEAASAPAGARTAPAAEVPPLAGVSEIASILGLSRQRASEVARLDGFPAPIAALASGPVWLQPAVLRFAETWERKPGSPRRSAPPPATATHGGARRPHPGGRRSQT